MKPVRTNFSSVVLAFVALTLTFTSCNAIAGIALGATRVVYPAGQKQVSLPVSSSDADGAFLIQSWVENAQDQKDTKIIVTPPLFMMQGKKENILRIIDASADSLSTDKETLFWLNVRAIPSTSPSQAKDNVLQIAVTTRIKLFYRPKNLAIPPEKAPEMLKFQRDGRMLRITNASPYFVTVTALRLADTPLENTMVPPEGSVSVPLKNAEGSHLSYQTINDYGAQTPAISVTL